MTAYKLLLLLKQFILLLKYNLFKQVYLLLVCNRGKLAPRADQHQNYTCVFRSTPHTASHPTTSSSAHHTQADAPDDEYPPQLDVGGLPLAHDPDAPYASG